MTWDRFRIALLSSSLFIACDGSGNSCTEDETRVGAQCIKVYTQRFVRLNSVGYRPEGRKLATISGGDGTFRVRSGRDVVLEGAGVPVSGEETAEPLLYVADFSEVTEPGAYVLEADGAGSSPRFRIASDVYVEVVQKLMLGLYGQRCGVDVTFEHGGETFEHAECHLEDAWLDSYEKPDEIRATRYGWHDAGDYGKYVNNGAFSLGMMLLAWQQFTPALEAIELEIPERGGAFPDFLDECKFQLDWLMQMQLEDGSVADRVTTRGFDGTVSPEDSVGRRRLSPATTTATADFVAVVARAARAFGPYDAALAEGYREAAERGWEYLTATPEDTMPPQGSSMRAEFTGGYWSSDGDDRFWAAAELWETTGDPDLLADLEVRAESARPGVYWDWPDMTNLGVFTYLLSEREGRNLDLVDSLNATVQAHARIVEGASNAHPYGSPLGYRYIWGSNGIAARTTMSVAVASAMDPGAATTYATDTIATTLDHLLGRNYYGRSYVTGLGYYPARFPHHRPSQADSAFEPWPGLLVGGPEATATSWNDADSDFRTNEIAINWNAAMIYAAASLLPAE